MTLGPSKGIAECLPVVPSWVGLCAMGTRGGRGAFAHGRNPSRQYAEQRRPRPLRRRLHPQTAQSKWRRHLHGIDPQSATWRNRRPRCRLRSARKFSAHVKPREPPIGGTKPSIQPRTRTSGGTLSRSLQAVRRPAQGGTRRRKRPIKRRHRAELQTIRESAVKVSARAGANSIPMLQNLHKPPAPAGPRPASRLGAAGSADGLLPTRSE